MIFLLFVVKLWLLLRRSPVFSLSAKPAHFQSFVFAPNGVCIKPSLFIEFVPSQSSSNATTVIATTTTTTASTGITRQFTMRNVPGDGDCMFQATALAAATSLGLGANMVLLRTIAKETRQVVASILESKGNLYIEQSRFVPARQLLSSAAKQEGITPEEYLILLRKEGSEGGLYGGGPELAVLSNVLRRPISVYELEDHSSTSPVENSAMDSSSCSIVCKGVFGAPIFRDPCQSIPDSAILSNLQPGAYSWHLHILVVDSGRDKHACVLLPQSPMYEVPGNYENY